MNGEQLTIEQNNYFGLYTGSKLVPASGLNWFEKDGFSVTIKYKGTDGKFTKEDIAGNVFTGHLTPMSVDDITKAAADDAEEFYLKNANGDYIVAQKYAAYGGNGDQATYTFTTVSEEALIEDIEHDGGKYFGVFKAEVSIKNVNLQELKTIDTLYVQIGNDWARLGRLDLGTDETPTLAASILGALMDIQISMGGNDLVQIKDLLKKGKFYTVELISSTDENVKTGKLAVAGDQYDDTWVEFVSSYGNVLEGQWALTVVDGKYRFTNRETTAAYWDDIAVSSLYKTDKPNEYRFGTETYRIEVVPEHAATDGYRTLSDVKNTKFNLGFSSEVFEGNAWFVENHEGVENHTIGLNSDIDEALDFTATEYAAARSKKHNDNHTYTYTPSDSIYVISELGYCNAKGEYAGTTKDTLKVVSYSFVNQYTEPLVYNSKDAKYESKVYKNADKKERYASVEEAAADADKFALRLDDNKLDGSIINLRVVKEFSRVAKVLPSEAAYNAEVAKEMYQEQQANPDPLVEEMKELFKKFRHYTDGWILATEQDGEDIYKGFRKNGYALITAKQTVVKLSFRGKVLRFLSNLRQFILPAYLTCNVKELMSEQLFVGDKFKTFLKSLLPAYYLLPRQYYITKQKISNKAKEKYQEFLTLLEFEGQDYYLRYTNADIFAYDTRAYKNEYSVKFDKTGNRKVVVNE